MTGCALSASSRISAAPRPKRVAVLMFHDNEQGTVDAVAAQSYVDEEYAKPLGPLGWRNGENLKVVQHVLPLRSDWKATIPKAAREIAEGNYDAAYVSNEFLTRALHEAAPRLPIVAMALDDPIGHGFARSYAKPGGMVTGIHRGAREVHLKQIEFLRRIVPGMSRIAWIGFRPQLQMHWSAFEWAAKEAAVSARQVFLDAENGRFPGLPADFAALRRDGYDCGQYSQGSDLDFKAVTELALRYRIALAYNGDVQTFQREGPLLLYRAIFGPSTNIETFMSKILHGEAPGNIPFQGPSEFRLHINLKTADRLGLRIPDDLRMMAFRLWG
jgi:putative ABC transport system substrate-binding protein